jgi:hypothetical protein
MTPLTDPDEARNGRHNLLTAGINQREVELLHSTALGFTERVRGRRAEQGMSL